MAGSLSAPVAATVDYPSSDGRPMAESDFQLHPLIYAVDRLRCHFRNDPDVYVSGNMLLYYEERNPRASVAPDVFVVFGAPDRERSSYFLWEERKAPDFVLEITSRSTWREDQGKNRELYHRLGVREYWQYDPTRDYLEPPLQETDDQRQKAEDGRRQEAAARQEAEVRAEREAAARQAAEARIAELEALLRGGPHIEKRPG